MPFVVELYFNPSTEACIRDAWKALDGAGISDTMPKGGYRPHVSLGVCDHLETDSLAQELSTFAASVAPFRLSFPNIGIFSTSEGVCFLGVTVTKQLLNLHTAFHEIFKKYAGNNGSITLLDNGCRIAHSLSVCQRRRLLKR